MLGALGLLLWLKPYSKYKPNLYIDKAAGIQYDCGLVFISPFQPLAGDSGEGMEEEEEVGSDAADLMQNKEFLQSVLSNLPGVNPEEALQNLEEMSQAAQEQEQEEREGQEEEGEVSVKVTLVAHFKIPLSHIRRLMRSLSHWPR